MFKGSFLSNMVVVKNPELDHEHPEEEIGKRMENWITESRDVDRALLGSTDPDRNPKFFLGAIESISWIWIKSLKYTLNKKNNVNSL